MSFVADDFAAIARRQRELGAVSDMPMVPTGFLVYGGLMDVAAVKRFRAAWAGLPFDGRMPSGTYLDRGLFTRGRFIDRLSVERGARDDGHRDV